MSFQKLIERIILKYLVVPKPPVVQSDKRLIACIGDSITFGAGVRENREVSTWEYHLEQKLGGVWQVLNYGISGRTLQNEGDYPYSAEKFCRLSHQVPAEVYIIMLGTNDAKPFNWNEARFADQYRSFVKSYVGLAQHPKVVLMTPPSCFADASGVVGYNIDPVNVDGPVYRTVCETAAELDLALIDLHAFTAGHPEWFDDGVHPNYEGNRALAEYIWKNLAL